MLKRFALVWTVGVVVVSARNAHALKPKAHADITMTACTSAGLPRNFCTRVATEDYNTDAREWENLSAHAQIATGTTACDAANAAVGRVWLRAGELHTALDAIRTGADSDEAAAAVARPLGRLLHTVQDQCAHHGMPNPQHAWFSLSDFCDGTTLSPDIQDGALACARTETAMIMASVAAAVRVAAAATVLDKHSCPEEPFGNDRNQNRTVCDGRILPSLFDACDFFGEAAHWDGIDRQWNGERVALAMRASFGAGLAGQGIGTSICFGNERVLSPAVSEPVVDIASGTPTCAQAHLVCFGKADDDDDADIENPFDDPEASAPVPAGCSTGQGATPGALVLVLFVLSRLGFATRRRVR